VLRKFWPKRDKVTVDWGDCIMRSWTPHPILFSWLNQGGWDGQGMWHVWERLEVRTGFWGKPEGKRPFGRPRHRKDNIKMDLQEIGCGEGMDSVDLAQDRGKWQALVNTVINRWVP
jgi:hypothetical protein